MDLHMQGTPMPQGSIVKQQYGIDVDDADDEEEMDDTDAKEYAWKHGYMAQLINGMIRVKCSYNSSLNIQFQGLAAYGVKMALWELAKAGYLPRMVNFVHDEVLYWLRPDEVDTAIPQIERLMIQGMKKATPHVKVGVESSLMLHWDKGAMTYEDMKAAGGVSALKEPQWILDNCG